MPDPVAISISGLPLAPAVLGEDTLVPVVDVEDLTESPTGTTCRAKLSQLADSVIPLLDLDTDDVADLSDMAALFPVPPEDPPPSLTDTLSAAYALLLTALRGTTLRVPAHTVSSKDETLADLVSGYTLSGRDLAEDDRVLLVAQLDGSENGLWQIQDAAPPIRPSDYLNGSNVGRCLVFVTHGDYAGQFYFSPDGGTVGGLTVWLAASSEGAVNYETHTAGPITTVVDTPVAVAPAVAGVSYRVKSMHVVNAGTSPSQVQILEDATVKWEVPVGTRGGSVATWADGISIAEGASLSVSSPMAGLSVSLEYRSYGG